MFKPTKINLPFWSQWLTLGIVHHPDMGPQDLQNVGTLKFLETHSFV